MLFLSTLTALAAVVSGASSVAEIIQRPAFDFSSIGNKFEFAGSFDSVSFFNYPSQQQLFVSNISSFNSSSNSLYFQDKQANIVPIGDVNGEVNLLVPYGENFVLSGSFSSIDLLSNSSTLDIGRLCYFDISSGSFNNLDPNHSIKGDIYAIYADTKNSIIYIGGDISYDDTYGAVIYNMTSQSLAPVPFMGFEESAIVHSISQVGDGSIVFGGHFHRLGLPQLQFTNQSYFLAHESALSLNKSSSDNSTESVEIQTEQLVSFKYASFQADNTAPGSVAASSITCPSNSNWEVNSNQLGAWLATLPFSVAPSKIRVYNSKEDNSGVKMFRLYTSPSNSIMNLTYIDPTTGKLSSCDAWCPLLRHSDLSSAYDNINPSTLTNVSYNNDGGVAANLQWTNDFQDFGFVNNIEVNYLNFHIVDYYGSSAGLNAIQMFSTQILTFANNTLNEPSCGASDNSSYSEVTGSGWELSVTGQFMKNQVQDTANSDAGVTFYPNITYSGNYSIDYITPGCQSDGTCSNRGSVQVTMLDENGNTLNQFTSAQSNQFEKIENVWNGHLNVTNGGRPKVQVKVANTGSGAATIVADKIAITILGLDDLVNGTNSTMGYKHTNDSVTFNNSEYKIALNGLFEYSLTNFSSFPSDYQTYNFSTSKFENKFVGNSSIDQYGANSISNGSTVNSLEYLNNTLFVAGDFSTLNDGVNIVGLNLDGSDSNHNLKVSGVSKLSDGLNGEVNQVKQIDSQLFVVGEFNGTSTQTSISSINGDSDNNALTKVAILSNSNQWLSIESGVANAAEISHVYSVNIDDTEFFVFYDKDYTQQSIWDNLNKKWFDNNNFNTSGLYMNVTAASVIGSGGTSLIAGHLSVLGKKASNAVSLDNKGQFSNVPVTFSSEGANIVNQALYVNDTFSVLGGNFTTTNPGQANLVINNNGKLSGFDKIEWGNSSVVTLSKDNSGRFLFLGLNGTASLNNQSSSNVIIYDLSYGNYSIPGALTKNGSTESAKINTFYYNENSNKVYVGGDFDTASALPCQSFCVFDMNALRWESEVSNAMSAGSIINYMNITSQSNNLLIGGEFNLDGSQYYFTNYDFGHQTFKTLDKFDTSTIKKRDIGTGIAGEVKKYILVDGSVGSDDRVLVLGDHFISSFNKSSWVRIDEVGDSIDSAASTFSMFQLINTVVNKTEKSKAKEATSYFDSNSQSLLVAGSIVFKNYNNITLSAAIFNGSNWYPYLYTTSDGSQSSQINAFLVNKAIAVDQAEAGSVKKFMDRGFIVLIGLALAVGTMMILAGLALAILFWKRKSDNPEVVQRLEEDEMIQTVPPQQLFTNMEGYKDDFRFTEEKQ